MRFAAFILIVVSPIAFAQEKPVPPLNQAVVKFAEGNLGKQVGNGECWTLIDEALAAAKAKRPGGDAWVFGKEVKPNEILPGDIMSVLLQGGGRHVAIISKVNGDKFDMLHQNVSNKRDVVRWTDRTLEQEKNNKVTFYRPVAP